MNPEISIIVPVYKVEQYLERCVQSLLNQTYKDIEIILVDDGSPDCCPKMCDEYAEKFQQIRVIHKPNGGLSSARLAGFKDSKGKYCLFIDSDDYLDNTMIEVLHSKASETGADLTMCSWYTEAYGVVTPHYWNTGWDVIDQKEIMGKYFLPLIGKAPGCDYSLAGFFGVRLIKHEYIEEQMFVSEREYIVEDVLFHLMLSAKLHRIAIIDEPHYYYCFNGDSLTNKYREGAWNKMFAFYRYLCNLCRANHVFEQATQGLQHKLLTAVAYSVQNACKINTYSDAKVVLVTIFTHPEVSQMFKTISRSDFSIQQRVVYLAWRTGILFPMYKYLRWRMKL